MEPTGVKINPNKPLPWELETFLLFSIKANEYQFQNFRGKNENEFVKIINCIKEFQHPKLKENIGTMKFADLIFISYGSTQFDIQTYNLYKYYRYNYFFNYVDENVNMKNEFLQKFSIDYDLFLKLGFSLNFFCSLKINLDPEILRYIVLKYVDATSKLMLSREEFSKKIDEYSNCIEDYLYCIRPSYKFPFIEYQGIVHFPLPHCMTRAITDSLLYRLTDGNSSLRDKFGKNVLEKYIFDIVNESNIYEEVLGEREYYKGKNKMKTPDVMVKHNNEYIFFESKATVAYAKTRIFEESYIDNEIDRISDNVIQLYKQVYNEFNTSYNFFENKEKDILKNNRYGVVVLLEESYIRRDLIYEKVLEKLNLNDEDDIAKWIKKHIKICNLHDIETHMFTSSDIIESIKNQERETDFLSKFDDSNVITNENLKKFKSKIIYDAISLRNELVENKLI